MHIAGTTTNNTPKATLQNRSLFTSVLFISVSFLYVWVNNEQLTEEDKVKSINVEALDRICKVLNCKLEDVIEFVEDDPKDS
ncbi:hypothetical protein BSK2_11695 [Bacillus subtilis]|nr:hypothetical protein BSK2_11695 [Bacillus subtilis]